MSGSLTPTLYFPLGRNRMFNHESLNIVGDSSLVYTAMSKHLFYFRMHISKYVLEQGRVPLNPFLLFDYFLLESVDRNVIRKANNSIVLRADEIWVFGPISNGVLSEILIANQAKKEIRYFQIEKPHKITPLDAVNVEMEEDVRDHKHMIVSPNQSCC